MSEEEALPGKNASIDIWLKAIDALKVDLDNLLNKIAKEPKQPEPEEPDLEPKPPEEEPDDLAQGPSMFDVLRSAEKDKDKKKDDKTKGKKPPVEPEEDEPLIPIPPK